MVDMLFFELLVVFGCILVGARIGGIGLGLMGGVGLSILCFGFGMKPTSPPIDVMLMIVAVVSAAACMQTAGGLDYMVKVAEKILRRNPKHITFIAPAVTYIFTMFAGTGHVAYSVLPVIAEVARRTGIRPERPLSISVIASQIGVAASPISAATVAFLGLLAPQGILLTDILIITIPATLSGVIFAALVANKMGLDLDQDAEYLRRLKDPDWRQLMDEKEKEQEEEVADYVPPKGARLSVLLFLLGAITVVMLGAFPGMRPAFEVAGELKLMSMAHAIEIVMLSVGALIVLLCRIDVMQISRNDVFLAGMRAFIAIFGVSWLGDTFFAANAALFQGGIEGMVQAAPWTFALALFALSIMVNSQGATIVTLIPLGLLLDIPALSLIAMYPAVNGYFFVPNYGPILAAIDFDATGTTKIGRYIFNHSFMVPGLLTVIFSVIAGFMFSFLYT